MIFGAMFIGVGVGLVAMVAAIATGSGVISAVLAYWLASCMGTAGVCALHVLRCRLSSMKTLANAGQSI